MDHYILHFFTGTMAFRSPLPDTVRIGAETSDAILEKCLTETNRNAGKAANCAKYARNMQDGNRGEEDQATAPFTAAENKQGRNGLGNGPVGQRNPAG